MTRTLDSKEKLKRGSKTISFHNALIKKKKKKWFYLIYMLHEKCYVSMEFKLSSMEFKFKLIDNEFCLYDHE